MNDGEAGTSRVAPVTEDFDVFLNHRGRDVKATFVAHLEDALRCAGHRPFLDARSLMKGNPALQSIDQAVAMAKVHVAVVSPGYAESKYCLNELVAMMSSGKPVVPVFYGVEPVDLWRVEKGLFAEAFQRHKSKGSSEKKVQQWREALATLAGITGFCSADYKRDESKLMRDVVDQVARLTPSNIPMKVDSCKVGLEGATGERHDLMMEKPCEYLMKLTRDYVDGVQAMPSPKFNIEQCEYLSEKLKTTLEKARVLLEEYQAQPSSIMDMNRWRESFKLLMVLGKQVECFFQECGKDAWIQTTMTLVDGGEYVSSIGFNLELCKVALCEKKDETKTLTMEEVGKLHANEVKIVKIKALVDAKTLLNKAIEAQQSSNAQDLELAKYLMFKLNGNTANPSFVEDNSNIITKLFQRVMNVGGRVEQIGRGSSARVYKVMWLGIPVAKKTFYGPSVEEFLQEVKVLSQLHHPNITSMFCCSMNKKECSIVMELMDGSLHDLLGSRKDEEDEFLPFTNLEGLNLMIQVGEGVEYLHRKKIVHRDLKSANILVKRVEVLETSDEFVLLKVVDFGLSKTKESSVSYSSMTYNVGSSRWMAPEIIKFNEKNEEVEESLRNLSPKYNFKGDIYSIGMVFMEILTGEVPFQSIGSEKVVKQMVLEGKRPLLPKYCIPRLGELIVECCSQEPNKRPSIGDICLELKYLKYILLTSGFSQGCSSPCIQRFEGVNEEEDREIYCVR